MVEPEVHRALDALKRLQQAVADFARRDQQLTRRIESRRGETAWRRHAESEGAEAAEKAREAELIAGFDARQEAITETARNRETRVENTAAHGLRMLPRRARDARGNWLANLQMQLLQAGNSRTAALEAAENEAGQIAAALTEECRRLILLKRETRKGFGGYRPFRERLRATGAAEGASGAEGLQLVSDALAQAEERLAAFRTFFLPRIFQYLPPPVAGIVCVAIGAALAAWWHFGPTGYAIGGSSAAVLLAATFALYAVSKRQVEMAAAALAEAVVKAEGIYEAVRTRSTESLEESRQAIQAQYEQTRDEISGQWSRANEVEAEFEAKGRAKIETQAPRVLAQIREQETRRAAVLATERMNWQTRMKEEAAARLQETAGLRETEDSQWQREAEVEWASLEAEWKSVIGPVYVEIKTILAEGRTRYPDWSEDWIAGWEPPHEFPEGAKFAGLRVDLEKLAGGLPGNPRLALPGPAAFTLPLALTFPRQGSLLIEGAESGDRAAMGALNALILRLLTQSPPGKVAFTIIDPVGLGQNFAGLMHLSDYEEALINRRIWTQQGQIEERLAELNEHIEKVIQMYLRNEYETISEYNEKAGSVAEKYHFLVVADFPAQFSETAARRLQSIAASGPRCGVFTLIQWDRRQTPPEGLAIEELGRSSIRIKRRGDGYLLDGWQAADGATLELDMPPEGELAGKLVHRIGQRSVDSNRVEVPFAQIAPGAGERWSSETTQEVKVAIGRTGATKPQYLAIGKGTRQHALFAGKTGSGKSTLFHVIITNLALWCSPEQVEFYLIDFKKGVEFKCYAEKRLPHARVVAIESDREFALSVLQRVDDELRRRGDLFRKLGVQDLAGYKREGGTERIPRTLLIIDEFQEFFVEDDSIAQTASLLFDRIVRQGRAFGIHVLLGSQTLGGAYTLARATLGQMVIRVALQCNEADAYLIMDDNNAAPRLLSRPGEGIYNDAAGAVEGNSPFQVVWLAEDERDRLLDEVREMAGERGMNTGGPIVFEGNAPAEVQENALLRTTLERGQPAGGPGRIWLGAPNSIKGPTEVSFQRQSGNNLLIVGQREEAAASMLGLALLALEAEFPMGRFFFFQGGTAGAQLIEAGQGLMPHAVTVIGPNGASEAMGEIAEELKRRADGAEGEPWFVFVNGLQRFKKLRHEDDFSFSAGDGAPDAGAQFDELIREGSAHGIHLLASVDAYSSVTRFISRKGIAEFEMRVVFQMSANDSATLIDSPKASGLGLHRALYFNEREGSLETFRPYAPPDTEWVAAISNAGSSRGSAGTIPSAGR